MYNFVYLKNGFIIKTFTRLIYTIKVQKFGAFGASMVFPTEEVDVSVDDSVAGTSVLFEKLFWSKIAPKCLPKIPSTC